jgi:hypothetical protein
MKKLIVLIAILTTTLTAFSQTDTSSKEPVKCFPISTVKKIIKDLKSGDEAKAQLKMSDSLLVVTEGKVVLKDSVINTMKIKEVNYVKIIDTQSEKYNVLEGYSKRLEWDLKKEKVKGKFKSILGTGMIAVLTFFLITK